MPSLSPALIKLLQQAYSAEKAAAFAYQGHAGSVKNELEKKAIHQIELDEWNHRADVLKIMQEYHIPIKIPCSRKIYFGFVLCVRLVYAVLLCRKFRKR
jgi:hypothetical protein